MSDAFELAYPDGFESATDLPESTPDPVADILAALREDQSTLADEIARAIEAVGDDADDAARAVAVTHVLMLHREALETMLQGAHLAAALEGMRRMLDAVPASPEMTAAAALASASAASAAPTQGIAAPESLAGSRLLPLVDEAARYLVQQGLASAQQVEQAGADARDAARSVADNALRDTHAVVNRALIEAVRTGGTRESFASTVRQQLADHGDSYLSDSAVENRFRTGVMSAYSNGQMRLVEGNPFARALFPYAAFHATHDDRVRHDHLGMETAGLDGTNVYRLDDPTFLKYRPPVFFNCLLPGNVVQGQLLRGFKSRYDGEVVEVSTRSGKRLTVTANHPVLTPHGFVPARLLQKGDYALRYGVGIEDRECANRRQESTVRASGANESGVAAVGENEHHAPVAAEQAFEALAQFGIQLDVPGRPDDFHGDAMRGDGHVDVVGSVGKLLLDDDATAAERGGNLLFAGVNESLPDVTGPGTGGRFGGAVDSPATGGISGGHLGGTGLGVHLAPLHLLRFGLAAHLNASRYEATFEDVATEAGVFADGQERFPGLVAGDEFREIRNVDTLDGILSPLPFAEGGTLANDCTGASQCVAEADGTDVEFARHLLQRFPGLVAADEIVDVRKYQWRGHVYDFQSPGGWIVSDDLIVSNCRCVWQPLSIEGAAKLGVKEAAEWLRTGTPPASPQWVAPPKDPPVTFADAGYTLAGDGFEAAAVDGFEFGWVADQNYKGTVGKWLGTGPDAGKKPRYQRTQPGLRKPAVPGATPGEKTSGKPPATPGGKRKTPAAPQGKRVQAAAQKPPTKPPADKKQIADLKQRIESANVVLKKITTGEIPHDHKAARAALESTFNAATDVQMKAWAEANGLDASGPRAEVARRAVDGMLKRAADAAKAKGVNKPPAPVFQPPNEERSHNAKEVERAAANTPQFVGRDLQDLRDYANVNAPEYVDINAALRGHPGSLPILKEKGERISAAINRLPPLEEPVTVYRGMLATSDAAVAFVKQLMSAVPGSEIESLGLLSTSHDPGIAATFAYSYAHNEAQQVMLEIKANKGASVPGAAGVNHQEAEFLMAHGAKFRVVAHVKVPHQMPSGELRHVPTIQLEQVA